MYTGCVQIFIKNTLFNNDSLENTLTRNVQKNDKRTSLKPVKCVHGSLYKINESHFFCGLLINVFLLKIYAPIPVYMHMSMWNCFFDFFRTLKC